MSQQVHGRDYAYFLRLLQARGLRPRTVTHYSGYVAWMLRWVDAVRGGADPTLPHRSQSPGIKLPIPAITPTLEESRRFLITVGSSKNFSSSGYNIIFNAVRHFMAMVCCDDGDPHKLDFGEGLRPQRRPPTVRQVLCRADVCTLLAAVERLPVRSLLTLMYGTGLRLGEARHLETSDIESGTGMMRVRSGKGGKQRRVPIPPTILEAMRDHWRRFRPGRYLFSQGQRPDAGPVPADYIQRHLHAAREAVGLHFQGCTHVLRHCFAHHQLAAGCDIRTLQNALGHSCLNTTVNYLSDLELLRGNRPPLVDLMALPKEGRS